MNKISLLFNSYFSPFLGQVQKPCFANVRGSLGFGNLEVYRSGNFREPQIFKLYGPLEVIQFNHLLPDTICLELDA